MEGRRRRRQTTRGSLLPFCYSSALFGWSVQVSRFFPLDYHWFSFFFLVYLPLYSFTKLSMIYLDHELFELSDNFPTKLNSSRGIEKKHHSITSYTSPFYFLPPFLPSKSFLFVTSSHPIRSIPKRLSFLLRSQSPTIPLPRSVRVRCRGKRHEAKSWKIREIPYWMLTTKHSSIQTFTYTVATG